MRSRLYTLILGLTLAAPLAAQAPKNVLTMRVTNVTAQEDAKRGLARRDTSALPGDLLRYTLVFVNRLPRAVKGVVLANPLPASMAYVEGSASANRFDARLEFSADSGKGWAPRPTTMVVEDGRSFQRVIPAELFTNVRWTVEAPLNVRDSVVAEFSARIRGSRSLAATRTRPSGR